MTRFVFAHFVDGIVNGIQSQLFGTGSDPFLIFAGAAFGFHPGFHIGLGIPNHFTQQFGKLRRMFCLLPCVTLERLGNFGISSRSA